jgi:hypothetical protein
VQAPEAGGTPDAFLRPLRADPAALEVLEAGTREEGAAAARGEVVLFVDQGVLASRDLVGAHARLHASGGRRLVLGYTPVRVLHERAPTDFGARLCAARYEVRCETYRRVPAAVLTDLCGGALSLRRDDFLALGAATAAGGRPLADRELGRRCLEAGIAAEFDPVPRGIRVYEPSLSRFVRDARAEGAALGVEEKDAAGSALDASASLALRALVLAAGSAHVWRLQDRAARLLWDLERRRGARV